MLPVFAAKEIIRAVESGCIEALKEITENNEEWKNPQTWVLLTDKKGRTLVHLASLHGHLSIIRYILGTFYSIAYDPDKQKGYLNITDNKGRTSLFYASSHGHDWIVRYLIEEGVYAEMSTNEIHTAPGSTALMAAAEKGYVECFKYLVDNGADVWAKRGDGADAFYLAARNGHEEIVKTIVLSDSMKILCYDIIDNVTFRGRTALSTAAFHGHLQVAKVLFAKGANLNHQDEDKFTPLMLASLGGHLNFVKWLAKKGADVSLIDNFGDTAFDTAYKNGHLDVMRFLQRWEDPSFRESFKKASVPPPKGNKLKQLASKAKSLKSLMST